MITVDGILIENLRRRMNLPIEYRKYYSSTDLGSVYLNNESTSKENGNAIVQYAAQRAYSLQINQFFKDGNTRCQ